MSQTQILTILESLQKSVAFLQENMVLKKDALLKEDALLKKDASQFATKDDLKSFATKDDLKAFATKHDIFYLKEEVGDLKKEVRTMKEEFLQNKSEIIAHIDGVVGLYQKVDLEVVALRSKCYRLEAHVQQLAKHTHLALE